MSLYMKDSTGKRVKIAGTGVDGKSAYQSALDAGYTGSEADFNKTLKDVPEYIASKGKPNGIASLGVNGKVPPEQLPEISSGPPVGSILWYAAQKAPDGYLICDGALVSRTDYADLFAVIGTTFGAGNGSTTFQLPDLRAAFIRGAGSQNGYSATFGQKQEATYINGYQSTGSADIDAGNVDKSMYSTVNYAGYSNAGQGSKSLNYVRPYNIALTPLIKY